MPVDLVEDKSKDAAKLADSGGGDDGAIKRWRSRWSQQLKRLADADALDFLPCHHRPFAGRPADIFEFVENFDVCQAPVDEVEFVASLNLAV